jgi:phage terminase large subunit-like protein
VDGRADFLHSRELPCVEPAVRELMVEQEPTPDGGLRYRIIGGAPTWEGQDLQTCERQINDWGLRAFLREAQQQVEDEEGGLWTREILSRTRVTSHPPLIRIVVAIDPNATAGGDEAGIIVAGVAKIDGVLHGYILEDCTAAGGPKQWAEAAVAAYHRHNADLMVAEANNGGEMVALTIKSVPGAPAVKLIHASRGKITRAEPVQKLYDDGRVHHVGHFAQLETEQCTYKPGMPSPNRMDAAVWAITELMVAPTRRGVSY